MSLSISLDTFVSGRLFLLESLSAFEAYPLRGNNESQSLDTFVSGRLFLLESLSAFEA